MNLKHLKTSQLMAIVNLSLPEGAKQVTKFATRGAGEKRVLGILTGDLLKRALAARVINSEEHRAIGGALLDYRSGFSEPELGAPKGITVNASKEVVTPIASTAGLATLVEKAPAPVAAVPATKPAVKKADKPAKVAKSPKEPKVQKKYPHLNLRCPVCKYYAKTTVEMAKKARLVCPVDAKHGKLLTAEERGEKRGR